MTSKLKADFFIDQYGNRFTANSRKELIAKIGKGRVSKMYVDTKDGRTLHVGYVVGQHWCSAALYSTAENTI